VSRPLHGERAGDLIKLLRELPTSIGSRSDIDQYPHKKSPFEGIGVLLTVDDVKATFKEKGTDGGDNSSTVGAGDKKNSEASMIRHADTPN
jgi:hypothetical protein